MDRLLLDARQIVLQQLSITLRVQGHHVRAHLLRHALLRLEPVQPAPLGNLSRRHHRQRVAVVDGHQLQRTRFRLHTRALRAIRPIRRTTGVQERVVVAQDALRRLEHQQVVDVAIHVEQANVERGDALHVL